MRRLCWEPRSTTRSQVVWTRTMPFSCSIMPSFPGRTFSCAAMLRKPTTSSPKRAFCPAPCFRDARDCPSSLSLLPDSCSRRLRPLAQRTTEVCRRALAKYFLPKSVLEPLRGDGAQCHTVDEWGSAAEYGSSFSLPGVCIELLPGGQKP